MLVFITHVELTQLVLDKVCMCRAFCSGDFPQSNFDCTAGALALWSQTAEMMDEYIRFVSLRFHGAIRARAYRSMAQTHVNVWIMRIGGGNTSTDFLARANTAS